MEKKPVFYPLILRLRQELERMIPADLSDEVIKGWLDDPDGLKQLVATLREGSPMSRIKTRTFDATIYPQRTPEEWVVAGGYHYGHPSLTTANLAKFLSASAGQTEPYVAKVVAFCLEHSATAYNARVMRQSLKLSPIGFEHQAAIGEQYPNAQCELGWIINPDCALVEEEGNCLMMPGLCCENGHRDFDLCRMDVSWGQAWFLGLQP